MEPNARRHGRVVVQRHDDETRSDWTLARPLLADERFHLKKAKDRATNPFMLANPEGDLSRTSTETDTSSWLQFFDLRVANQCEQESAREYPPGWDP
jgi:hypothetical protein